jgi:hypothetical protein
LDTAFLKTCFYNLAEEVNFGRFPKKNLYILKFFDNNCLSLFQNPNYPSSMPQQFDLVNTEDFKIWMLFSQSKSSQSPNPFVFLRDKELISFLELTQDFFPNTKEIFSTGNFVSILLVIEDFKIEFVIELLKFWTLFNSHIRYCFRMVLPDYVQLLQVFKGDQSDFALQNIFLRIPVN